ncbi:hypothetical protein TTHERM_00239420 (macronuclear) [Tetrahymena thermophila SB210]|uniref:Uncharacterized protein n=1 Tax=Tetrahymena thermophila (strain SB210) TaxID=312017 RepID=I7M3Z9_TETTS|nr:hypothetical protein TTHERM_00239420 [Tetrahymena thermophila SB210]EAS04621.2 hypothetical protein TTHERM_00239420 [Tetrahymena thermophila SB210]|eukprot:XP_001024866.2 hypothetical protein TTHERM_00239420 [Tetrahymena thermophila SB210]
MEKEEEKKGGDDSKQSVVDEQESDYSVMSSLYKDAKLTQGFFGKNQEVNHLTMILNSIHHFSGREEDYENFYNRYVNDYDIEIESQQTPCLDITDKNWQNYSNNKENYQKFQQYFGSKWELMGKKNILKIYLPVLTKNPSCGFFHPLIKMGHTCYLEDTTEITNTLSVWACCYFQKPDYFNIVTFKKGDEGEGLENIFDKLRESREMQTLEFISGTHEERINKLFQSKEFYHLCSGYQKNDDTLKQLTISVCSLYLDKPCFATMHLVEACEGLRQTLQMLSKEGDKEDAIFQFYLGICATYVSIGMPKVSKLIAPTNLPPWSTIYNKTLLSHDEHVLLLVYACTKLYYMYKGFKNYEIIRWVAASELNLTKN